MKEEAKTNAATVWLQTQVLNNASRKNLENLPHM